MTEEGKLLYEQALVASEDLRSKLSKVRIKIDAKKSKNVVDAVVAIFGDTYLLDDGGCYLTYDMYCSVVNLIRTLGTHTAMEAV